MRFSAANIPETRRSRTTFCLAQEISIFQLSQTVFEKGWFRTNFFDGTCRQKNRAVDGRKLRVEDSKLSPICCVLLSTFSSLKRSDWPPSMAFAFEKLMSTKSP